MKVNIISITSAVCLGLLYITSVKVGAQIATPPGDNCLEVLVDDKDPCPSCLGIQTCTCLSDGSQCPTKNIGCSFFPKTRAWDQKKCDWVLSACRISRNCRYKYGGTSCHPENNPCEIYGDFQIVSDYKPRQTQEDCD